MRGVEGWEKTSLGDQLELIRNGYSGEQVTHLTDFPVSRIETISEGTINFDKVGYADFIPDAYLLKPGDILFSNINSIKHIGKVAQVDQGTRLFHGMNLLVLRPLEQVDKKFFFYKLVSAKPWFEKVAAQAINQASINQATVKQLQLELPQRKLEQAKIAEVLSLVDRTIEQTGALIAKQERIKTGLMQDLLTRGIDEHGNLRSEETHQFKDSPLGRIPAEWEVVSTGEVSRSLVPGRDKPDLDGGGIPWITVLDIDDMYVKVSKNGLSLSQNAIREANARLMPKGTVIMSCVGEFGLAAIAKTDVVANQQLHGFVCNHKLLPEWLLIQLTSSGKRIEQMATQTTIKYLNKTGCESIKIAVPDIEEQERGVVFLSRVVTHLSNERKRLGKLRSLKTALMQDLLTGKVRVTPLLDSTEVMSE